MRSPCLLALAALLTSVVVAARPEEVPRYAPREGTRLSIDVLTALTYEGKPPDATPLAADSPTHLTMNATVVSSDGVTSRLSYTLTSDDAPSTAGLSSEAEQALLTALSQGRTAIFRAFLSAESIMTVLITPARPDGSFVGASAGRRVVQTLRCPWDVLDRFLPIGRTPVVSTGCTSSREVAGQQSESASRIVIAYEGDAATRTAAGEFSVKRVRVQRADADGTMTDQVLLFSERVGVAVVTETTTKPPGGRFVLNSRTEVTRIE